MRSSVTSRVVPAAGAVLLLTALTGCTFSAVQATQKAYDPSDGIGTTVGDIEVRNALLVTDDGETANLVVNVVNTGAQNIALTVSWESANGQVERNVYLTAGGSLNYGEESNRIILSGIDAELGGLFPVYFQYDDEPGDELLVPVLDGGLAEYSELVPGTDDE